MFVYVPIYKSRYAINRDMFYFATTIKIAKKE